MQDGENPVQSGAAAGSAPSGDVKKTGFKLDFSPEAMRLKEIAAQNTRKSAPVATESPESVTAQPSEPQQPSETTNPELAAAQAEFAAAPQLSGEVDMEQLMADESAESGKPTEAIDGESLNNAPEENLAEEKDSFEAAPVDTGNIGNGSPIMAAPQKQGLSPKVVILICLIGVLVVAVVVLLVLWGISKAAPAVEETVEEATEAVEETVTRRVMKLPEKKETTESTESTESEEQAQTEETPVEEVVEVDPNLLVIDIPEANTRIKLNTDGNFVNYRKVGNKIMFWAATKREGDSAQSVTNTDETNCISDESTEEAEATNCVPSDEFVPEFADKLVNTKGMASLTWWKAENPDAGTTVFKSDPWYIIYSTQQSPYSQDEESGRWESESAMFLFDELTNAQIYEVLPSE